MRYCNITTDLFRIYPRIEELKEWKTLKAASWSVHSGSTYKIAGIGYGEMLFEDGAQMTAAASLVAIAAGKFFYDADTDILYAVATTGTFTDYTYKWGIDWDTLKGWAADQGSQMLEALLDPKFPVPLIEYPGGSSTQKYDGPVIQATAYFAASLIAGRQETAQFDQNGVPQNLAAQLFKSGQDIVTKYNDGTLAFSWAVTSDEIGSANITPAAANTSIGMFQIRGVYSGLDDARWVLKCSLGGDVATATFLLSADGGVTYGATVITSSYAWVDLAQGLLIRFFGRGGGASAFIITETWNLEVTAADKRTTNARIGNIELIG